MKELKKKISKHFAEYKKAWIDEFTNAQKEKRGVKLENIMTIEAEMQPKLDEFFADAEERVSKLNRGRKPLW